VKVVVVAACPYPAPFGTQVLVRETCEGLSERGHDVHLVSYSLGSGRPFQPLYAIHRCSRLPGYGKMEPGPAFGKPLQDVFLLSKLMRVIRQVKPQVVHAHNYEGAAVGLAAGRVFRVPVVYHMHGLLSEELPYYSRLGAAARPMARRIDRVLVEASRVTLCSSEEERDLVVERLSPTRPPEVVFPSVDLERFSGEGRLGKRAQPVVFYSGNLDSYQGIDFLLGAFAKAAADLPGAKLRIASHSDGSRVLGEASRRGIAGQVEFLRPRGFEAELDMLFEAAVCVCPRTLRSGFPMKVLNYMAASKPVVLTRSAARGLAHLEQAWVADDGDEDSFAEGMLAFVKDRGLGEKVSRQARSLVERRHSRAVLVERLESVYEKAILA